MDSAEPSVRGRGADAVERLHEQLQVSLRALVSSEDWRQALEVAARFHDYSFANTRLIWAQAKARGFTPTRVAGYRAWQRLGRPAFDELVELLRDRDATHEGTLVLGVGRAFPGLSRPKGSNACLMSAWSWRLALSS